MVCMCPQEQLPPEGQNSAHNFAWFLRPSQLKTVPYFELPMPISRVRLLMQFRMGSHALPVEQGRLAKPAVPRHLRRCTLCGTRALGDERHFVFDCPILHIRRQIRSYQDADGTMQCFCVAQGPESCLPLPSGQSSMWLMTPTKTRPHKPMLAEWTSEILFLSKVRHSRQLTGAQKPCKVLPELGPLGESCSRGAE